MGEKFDGIMDAYFDNFKERMQSRLKNPKQLVKDYEQDICFLVDYDSVHIQIVKPRIAWVKPLSYAVNIDEKKDIIEDLISEPIESKVT